MEKVYGFTNENIKVFSSIFNFDNARVLTVLGSGDQYFDALLNGAIEVEVFDINVLAWYHFILKYTAIKILSYEEFKQMFVIDNLDNLDIYKKIRPYLLDKVRCFFDKLIILCKKISSIKINNTIFSNAKIENISYLDINLYYKLQSILTSIDIPLFYNCNLLDIQDYTNKAYDISLFSNVYHYLSLNAKEYHEFLSKINSLEIMALYTWILNNNAKKEFLINGFDIYRIPGVLNHDDYIVTLRKKQ